VRSCHKDGSDAPQNTMNACGGGGDLGAKGPSYSCVDQQPFTDAQGTLMVFSASNTECCACYELEFQSGPLSGRRAVTQVTNSGTDLGAKHFDLMMPGGGFGIFNGCTGPSGQFSGSESAWGARYGGVASRAACDNLPADVQQGCRWRFDSSGFAGADNPSVRYRRVRCPTALTRLSLCSLNDDNQFPAHTASSTLPAAGGPAPIAPPSTSGCVATIASGLSFSGRCMSSTAACLTSGAAPGESQSTGCATGVCCAKMSCSVPVGQRAGAFATQCADRTRCRALRGTGFPSSATYENTCSGHSSSNIVCCAFDSDPTLTRREDEQADETESKVSRAIASNTNSHDPSLLPLVFAVAGSLFLTSF
jgi:hypothetical protein